MLVIIVVIATSCAGLEDEDLVGPHDGREPVRDDDGRAAPAHPVQRLLPAAHTFLKLYNH